MMRWSWSRISSAVWLCTPTSRPARSSGEAPTRSSVPVAGSTLTTVVVFAPLGLLQGVVGNFFRSFALALAVAVLLSLVVAMTLIPPLAGEWLPGRGRRSKTRRRGSATSRWHGSSERTAGPSAGARAAVARRRDRAGTPRASLFGLSRMMGTGFHARDGRGRIHPGLLGSAGRSAGRDRRQVPVSEQIRRADPDVQSFTRRTGIELGFAATPPNTRRLHGAAEAAEDSARHRSTTSWTGSALQAEAEAPAVRVEFDAAPAGSLSAIWRESPEPVELKLFHPDRRPSGPRRPWPGDRADARTGGSVQRRAGQPAGARVDLDPVRVSRLGLTIEEASAEARSALLGEAAGTRARARPAGADPGPASRHARFDPEVARRVPVVGPRGLGCPWATLGGSTNREAPASYPRKPAPLRRGDGPDPAAGASEASCATCKCGCGALRCPRASRSRSEDSTPASRPRSRSCSASSHSPSGPCCSCSWGSSRASAAPRPSSWPSRWGSRAPSPRSRPLASRSTCRASWA